MPFTLVLEFPAGTKGIEKGGEVIIANKSTNKELSIRIRGGSIEIRRRAKKRFGKKAS